MFSKTLFDPTPGSWSLVQPAAEKECSHTRVRAPGGVNLASTGIFLSSILLNTSEKQFVKLHCIAEVCHFSTASTQKCITGKKKVKRQLKVRRCRICLPVSCADSRLSVKKEGTHHTNAHVKTRPTSATTTRFAKSSKVRP